MRIGYWNGASSSHAVIAALSPRFSSSLFFPLHFFPPHLFPTMETESVPCPTCPTADTPVPSVPTLLPSYSDLSCTEWGWVGLVSLWFPRLCNQTCPLLTHRKVVFSHFGLICKAPIVACRGTFVQLELRVKASAWVRSFTCLLHDPLSRY